MAFSGYYLQGYAVLISSAVVLCILIAFATELLGLRAARILYFSMLRNVIQAPMRYVACCFILCLMLCHRSAYLIWVVIAPDWHVCMFQKYGSYCYMRFFFAEC